MTGAHGLHRLAFATVGRAPERPVGELADGVTGIPKFRGDAAVTGILQHADFLAALDLPADFRGELELIPAVINGPRAICFHEDAVAGVGDEISKVPGAGQQADICHSNDWQAIPAFSTHGSGRTVKADKVGSFAIRKITAELAILDNVRALRRDTFVIVSKRAEARAVIEPRIRHDVDDAGSVFQMIELVERQKTGARKIGFLAKNPIELDGVPDGFVNLQAELASAEDDRSRFLRALRSGVQRRGFFRDDGRVAEQIKRFDELVTLERVLSTETIRVGALLNFFFLERCGGDPATGNHFSLVNTGTDAGGKPRIDLAKLHVRFGERDTFHSPHCIVGCEQQCNLAFKRNLEWILPERALPAIDVGFFRRKNNVAAFREGRSFGNRDGLRRAGGDALSSQPVRGCKTPGAVGQDPNSNADGFALRESADLSVFCRQVALA